MTASRHPPAPSLAPQRDARQRLISSAAIAIPTVGALVISFLVTPADIESGRVVLSAPCLTRVLFGIPCPTCGLTRAFTALSHGDWGLAWSYNRSSPLVYGLFWAGAAVGLGRLLLALWALRQAQRSDQ